MFILRAIKSWWKEDKVAFLAGVAILAFAFATNAAKADTYTDVHIKDNVTQASVANYNDEGNGGSVGVYNVDGDTKSVDLSYTFDWTTLSGTIYKGNKYTEWTGVDYNIGLSGELSLSHDIQINDGLTLTLDGTVGITPDVNISYGNETLFQQDATFGDYSVNATLNWIF